MLSYILRRLLYTVPVLFGVLLFTFVLFYATQTPDDIARRALQQKATPENIARFIHERGLDKPKYLNFEPGQSLWDSQFCHHFGGLLKFDLGKADLSRKDLNAEFKRGALASLAITVPAFILGLLTALGVSLYLVLVRNSLLDTAGVFICAAMLSIPTMVWVIFGQSLGVILQWFPVFGFKWAGLSTIQFLALPVALMVVAGLGADVRLYRSIFFEEIAQDYVRTARAKGVANFRLLFVHVLKNGAISLITLVVSAIPLLVLGSIVVENFFGIPGLGSQLAEAIQGQDFAVIRANVWCGSLLYMAGLLITDIGYALADPRIRLS